MSGGDGWQKRGHSSKRGEQPKTKARGYMYRRVGTSDADKQHLHLRQLRRMVDVFFENGPSRARLTNLTDELKRWFAGLMPASGRDFVTYYLFVRLELSQRFEAQLRRLKDWAVREAQRRGQEESDRLRRELEAWVVERGGMRALSFEDQREQGLRASAMEAMACVTGDELSMGVDDLMALLSTGDNTVAAYHRVTEAYAGLTRVRRKRERRDDDDFFDSGGPSTAPAPQRPLTARVSPRTDETPIVEERRPTPPPKPPRYTFVRDPEEMFVEVVESEDDDEVGARDESVPEMLDDPEPGPEPDPDGMAATQLAEGVSPARGETQPAEEAEGVEEAVDEPRLLADDYYDSSQ